MTWIVPVLVAVWLASLGAAYKFGRHEERILALDKRVDTNAHEVGSAWIDAAAELKAMRHRLEQIEDCRG